MSPLRTWLSLEEIVLAADLEGLGDAPVELEPRLVRLGYLVPAALRNTFMPFGMVVPQSDRRVLIERSCGRPFEEWVERQVVVRRL